ncbi:beta strand repeat-containing protein [Solirubrobacter soli]|uniref:beta strand repeat-containing protein n=1 Tax=Solirubrobacter soli TaxID=363832 RepID=UPI000402EE25|nr:calcium-binding protein [Solirubrobacter soli]
MRRSLAVTAVGLTFLGLTATQASASYTASVQGTTLEVAGDKASDKLTFAANGTALALDVGSDGTIDFQFDRSTFDKVHVNAGDGDDEISTLGNLADEAFTIEGGAGNDRLLGSNGNDVLDGGPGNDFVDGNQGTDTARLGTGNDTFQWDPGDGNDTVDGDAGADVLQFNGSNASEDMDVSANGARTRFTRNIANIVMDLGTIERVNVRTLGGTDNVTVNDLAGTGLGLVDVDESGFDGQGDGAKDNVIVNGTNDPDTITATSPTPGTAQINGLAAKVQVDNAEFTQDLVTVNGLFGDDTIAGGVGVTGPASIVANGGDGADTAKYVGTNGDDTDLFLAAAGTGIARVGTPTATGIDVAAGGGTEETLIQTLGGNDKVSGQNGVSTASHFTIDGGNGDDTLLGGDGDDLILGGAGNDLIDGNRGSDTARMGSGNDTFQWDPGDGNDTVDGETGADVLQFNGSNAGEEMAVSANGARTRFTRNIANIVMDLGTIERVNVRALGSVDNVTVNDLNGTGVKLVDVDEAGFDGQGDGAKDNVIVNGTSGPDKVTATSPTAGTALISGLAANVQVDGAEFTQDLVTVNGLAGDDTITSGVGVTGPAAIVANGGDDDDTAKYLGTSWDDQIFFAAAGTGIARVGTATTSGLDVTAGAGTEETLIQGLDGNDTIQGQNGIAGDSHFTIDGGNGDDTLGGGDGDDLLLGGQGNDHVDGNRGTDTANLGIGDDRFQWDPGDGNDVIDGQSGFDGLDFNGSNAAEDIQLSANGSRGRLTRNIANITMDYDNLEDVVVRSLGSADKLTVNDLRGTDVTNVDLQLGGFGGGGDATADQVIVNGSERPDNVTIFKINGRVDLTGLGPQLHIFDSEPTLDTLQVNTLGGKDSVVFDNDISDLIAATVDLGADQ